jgi:hypothetical protein
LCVVKWSTYSPTDGRAVIFRILSDVDLLCASRVVQWLLWLFFYFCTYVSPSVDIYNTINARVQKERVLISRTQILWSHLK